MVMVFHFGLPPSIPQDSSPLLLAVAKGNIPTVENNKLVTLGALSHTLAFLTPDDEELYAGKVDERPVCQRIQPLLFIAIFHHYAHGQYFPCFPSHE